MDSDSLSKMKKYNPTYTLTLTPYLSEFDFSNSPVGNIEFDELDFFPSLKPTGYFFQFKPIFTHNFFRENATFSSKLLSFNFFS